MAGLTTAASGIFEPPVKPKITKEMKLALKESGKSKLEQKQELSHRLKQMKENYAREVELWNKKPDISDEEIKKYKDSLLKLKEENAKKIAEAKEIFKKEALAARSLEPAAARLALLKAKDKKHNAILDLKEEIRAAEAKMNKACKSSAEVYRIQQRTKTLAAIWRDKNLYLMLIPFVAFYIIFAYMPMYGLQIAFKDYSPFKGIWGSPWAPDHGLYYFKSFFTGPYAGRLITNTLTINVLLIIFGFPVPIIFALMLNEVRQKMFKTSIQTLSYLPHFVSIVVVAGLVTNFLSPSTGIINFIYRAITGADEGIYFLSKPEYFRTIYIIMDIWKGAGFGSIIYTSALSGIDMELYEAARIDGAGRWKQLTNITIPGIMPTIAIMLIMRVGSILNLGYEAIILLYQPATYVVADVISTYVYRAGLIEGNYPLSTAVGLFNGIVALIMVMGANTVSRKVGEVGLW